MIIYADDFVSEIDNEISLGFLEDEISDLESVLIHLVKIKEIINRHESNHLWKFWAAHRPSIEDLVESFSKQDAQNADILTMLDQKLGR